MRIVDIGAEFVRDIAISVSSIGASRHELPGSAARAAT